jgi:hypothetical protein
MTINELRAHYEERPFQPFRIHAADGRSVDVDHPEFMAFSRSGRVTYVSKVGGGFETIDLLLISSLERIPKKPSRGRNGRQK